jgi:16S rRNA (uracil1498-N3)-methyltransferase
MQHFFIPPQNIEKDGRVRFPKETIHQLIHVLRLESGDEVIVLDNVGNQYNVILSILGEKEVTGRFIESRKVVGEPKYKLTLYISMSQRQKFEWMIQKCTEVGAAGFVPLITERSLVQEGDSNESRQVRWRRIIQEAAEQSGRGLLPTLSPPMRFTEGIEHARHTGAPGLILCTDEKLMGLKEATQAVLHGNDQSAAINVMIGPEGGFTRDEVNLARSSGFLSVSLGRRVLRMETAAVVATALLLYDLGDLLP